MKLISAGTLLASSILVACSDSGPTTGKLNLAVTDAVVDVADKVVIEFESVTVKHSDSDPEDITLDSVKTLDLLQLSGGVSATLVTDEELLAGDYEWVRLHVNETFPNTYIEIAGMQYPLTIPSNAQNGLKLNRGFTIPAGGTASFTVDFDLRKSVVEDANGYKLKPVLRIVDNVMVGSLSGTIDSTLMSTECDDSYAGAVYVFDDTATSADDVDGVDPDPLTSAVVDETDNSYYVAFLEAGDYQVSYSCQADEDHPELDDSAIMNFTPLVPVTIEVGVEKIQDIN